MRRNEMIIWEPNSGEMIEQNESPKNMRGRWRTPTLYTSLLRSSVSDCLFKYRSNASSLTVCEHFPNVARVDATFAEDRLWSVATLTGKRFGDRLRQERALSVEQWSVSVVRFHVRRRLWALNWNSSVLFAPTSCRDRKVIPKLTTATLCR